VLRRGGLTEDAFAIGGFAGEVQGYVIDRPMRTRDALEPLLAGLGLITAERDGRVAVIGDEAAVAALTMEAMVLPDEGASLKAERVLERRPGAARVRYIDGEAGYQTGSVVVRSAGEGGAVDLDLPPLRRCPGAGSGGAGPGGRRSRAADRLARAGRYLGS